jgi:hypothetical protein
LTPNGYPEHLNALLLAIFINAALGGGLLAVWLGMMAQKYRNDMRNGINGLSRAMFLFFLALAGLLLALGIAFGVLLIDPQLITPVRILIAGAMFLFFLAMVYLHLESHRGDN